MSVYQLFVKIVKNQDITKYLSVSLFLGVKLGVDFEVTLRRMKILVFSDFGVQMTVSALIHVH